MKKLFFFFALFLVCFGTTAQTVTLTFTGKDAKNQYVKLDRVVITNLTQNWQETIFYPDTILMVSSTGIDDIGASNHSPIRLSQNVPNPFDGTTDVVLETSEAVKVVLEVVDVNGHAIVETRHGTSLPAGTHRFRVVLSTVGTYFFIARCGNDVSTIKMVNNGRAGENTIIYLGEGRFCPLTVTLKGGAKGTTDKPFVVGDKMRYVGYAIFKGSEYSSEIIEKNQTGSEMFALNYPVTASMLPSVTTADVSDITARNAVCGGNVSSDGETAVTARGICWSVFENPTISQNHTTDGSGTGSFTSSLTGLTAGTTYYVRAYATNSVGTAYGEEKIFTTSTAVLPTVATTVNNIAATSAICGGNITYDGGAEVTNRGVCWSTSPSPTIRQNRTTEGGGMGVFTSSLKGLVANTTYYVRAYACNSKGTAYGDELSFTTLSYTCGSEIGDCDGNIYNTIRIGKQCWMQENLRTTKYVDGTPVWQGSSGPSIKRWYYPHKDSTNKETYGLLYNWTAVMNGELASESNPSGVQGICPVNWHVPSDAEWTQLTDYVRSQSRYQCNSSSSIAKSLAAAMEWRGSSVTCAVGNAQSSNNATGFSAFPAGSKSTGYDIYWFGDKAFFWSATKYGSNYVYARSLHYDNVAVNNFKQSDPEYNCLSVRCLYDSLVEELPAVSTLSVSDITNTTVICRGNVTSDGGVDITARGVCWSTSPNPTISHSHTTVGGGIGIFISSLTGLAANTTYYVRTYATNSVGTAYGEELSFITSSYACGNMITDCELNIYNTVQLGNQCWMKENLKTTRYADGTSISYGISYGSTETSTTVGYWYYPMNSSSSKATHGLLYNWKAVMRNAFSSNANPSEVQGICPTGWHVPSDAEWTQMIDYVGSQSQYQCGGSSTNTAKALAATTGWNSSSDVCCVGNNLSTNNATGFSALPAGDYQGGNTYLYAGHAAFFWSATENSSSNAYVWVIGSSRADVKSQQRNKYYGYSVRCIRDLGVQPPQ